MERSKYYQDYPEPVALISEKFITVLEESRFFSDEDVDENITFKEFADSILPKWINGEDIHDEELLSEDDFSRILNLSIFKTNLESLRNKNLIDSIEDEKGEEIFFLTKKGKEVTNYFNESK